jgi:Acetyltransferase (GNAT) domain
MLRLERLPVDDVDFGTLDRFEDRIFCQRLNWLKFIQSFINGEIIISRLDLNGNTLGYFTGIMFRRLGVPILGSPFRGWTTPYMGFNLVPGVSRPDALSALKRFAFGELRCSHLEIADRHFDPEDGARLGFAQRAIRSYLSDLTQSESEIFAKMDSSRRRAIRKAQKSGLTVEAASPEGFAEEYYDQLRQVFAWQGLTPTYSMARVQKLIDHVYPSGDLLLVRAREPGGKSIATAIYAGFGRLSFFWGNASLREYQFLRPNEALHWFALRYWKDRGMWHHDWGGGGAFKARFGGTPFAIPAFRKSRHKFIQYARDAAEHAYYFPRELRKLYEAKVRKKEFELWICSSLDAVNGVFERILALV